MHTHAIKHTYTYTNPHGVWWTFRTYVCRVTVRFGLSGRIPGQTHGTPSRKPETDPLLGSANSERSTKHPTDPTFCVHSESELRTVRTPVGRGF